LGIKLHSRGLTCFYLPKYILYSIGLLQILIYRSVNQNQYVFMGRSRFLLFGDRSTTGKSCAKIRGNAGYRVSTTI